MTVGITIMSDQQINYISFILTSVSALGIVLTYLSQRIHNRKMVAPMVSIVLSVEHGSFLIKLKNFGMGPAKIIGIVFDNKKKGTAGKSNIEFIDLLNVDGINGAHEIKTNFPSVSRRNPIYLLSNETMILFEFPIEVNSGNGNVNPADEIQAVLSEYFIKLKFLDIYRTIHRNKFQFTDGR